MKKIFLVAITFCFLSTTNFANAGEIAILDIEKIVKESKAMKYIQNKVSKQQDKYQKLVTSKQSQLEKDQKKVEGKKSVLSEEAFAKELAEFEQKVDELKEYVDRKQNSLKKASLDAMSKVNDVIKNIISDIAKEKNIDIIIPANQALYFKDSMDISEEVLEKLNNKIAKVKVTFDD
ncbi:MAG: OmpH family outer membrane protein [Rickettsiales bacterium]|nr:OmpH family outer membrane protein [Rickettsiales bacterium]